MRSSIDIVTINDTEYFPNEVTYQAFHGDSQSEVAISYTVYVGELSKQSVYIPSTGDLISEPI